MLFPRLCLLGLLLLAGCAAVFAQPPALPGTAPLTGQDDLAKRMVEGIHAYLDRELAATPARRAVEWRRDFTDVAHYSASVESNRERLRGMIGLTDTRAKVHMRLDADIHDGLTTPGLAGTGAGYRIYRVRWNVFRGVEGEGLLLVPNRTARADVIALPDCDASPEMLCGLAPGVPTKAQFARRLAENGCRVLVPALIDRSATYSGNPAIAMTNQPHREYLYRAAYELGRHIIGYEVQKMLAAVDWFFGEGSDPDRAVRSGGSGGREENLGVAQTRKDAKIKTSRVVGVIGYGEGGLVAFYSAAVDTRIGAAAVSGYFAPREKMPGEPIYRNVFGLLREFGDAEIASLIVPRRLIVEACRGPEVAGPPETGRRTAASGVLKTYPLAAVESEFQRAVSLTAVLSTTAPPVRTPQTGGNVPPATDTRCPTPSSELAFGKGQPVRSIPDTRHPTPFLDLTISTEGHGLPGTDATLNAFMAALGNGRLLAADGAEPSPSGSAFDMEARRKRQFDQIAEDTQVLMRESPLRRKEFWSHADFSSPARLAQTTTAYRETFWKETLGWLPEPALPPNPKARQVYDTPKFTGYEVTLDLYPDVFAYGILLVPKGIPAGERRPVVVCQHGLEGRAQDVADPTIDSPYYHRFACQLAERGYITFAPQNPYIGEDRFRTALRKAQPLKLTLFSFIVRQHEAILKWLAGLPSVDPARIAFYGLSYGGKTAMRVPAVLPGYCLSICSGDYNEWIWKCCSMSSPYSYLFTNEYDMPEWNLANTFNYAEMSWLICPRPFMVERGHNDGVAPDEWVAYEYANTRRVYDLLDLGDRTELEMFNGPHTIHGVGTFAFLDRILMVK